MGRKHPGRSYNLQKLPDEMPEPDTEAEPGSFCDAHYLFQTAPDERGRTSWSEDVPKNAFKPGENTLSGKESTNFLKKFLSDVMKGYPGLTFTLARVEFNYPFKPFVHRWDIFCQERDTVEDPKVKSHVDLLYSILKAELGDLLSEISDLLKSQVIKHDLIWALFEPGKLIYSVIDDRQRVFVFKSGDFDNQTGAFRMSARYIDSDGTSFGYQSQNLSIQQYEGTSSIMDLTVFPLAYHKNEFEIRTDLIARGELWQMHKEYRFRFYKGLAKGYSEELRREIKFKVNSRVAIDGEAYNIFNPDYEIKFSKRLSKPRRDTQAHYDARQDYQQQLMMLERQNRRRLVHQGSHNSIDVLNSPMGNSSMSDPTFETADFEISSKTLSNRELLISTPIIRGFSLKDKMWLEFFIDGVEDIVWNSDAFDNLVLPHSQQDLKKLILGFAKAQSKSRDTFDDIIKGKGRGIIMLLKGPPGVGKTLTAESVAEVMRVPLYSLSAGDLGTTAENVERSLRDILKMVPRWGAIILLDEADVFMEARDTIDLARNELVTIFLRLLEYYEGILFLTTNRAARIDPAFDSRIHLSIRYPELTADSRRHIWRQFITENNSQRLSEAELDSVSSLDLNGRQIKNVVRTAHLLAGEDESGLSFHHIQTILNLRDCQEEENIAA
ncbi:P-loop containing nucleoside triphosphate hydrolase protein [Penicillium hetheringtonii]|uniref:P-loop containing nucleoside triphosphate hydrolase protein n=1 Tax=Penicillium hetheringtonii TaxID=911720 RepID=A0AAD6DDE0_9EURO|nr:P-loop containing nucleoside triphosphate hydrolase protein [Penicillium hetheringtonii]